MQPAIKVPVTLIAFCDGAGGLSAGDDVLRLANARIRKRSRQQFAAIYRSC